MQFAHQNLVVHRDLKPGNILITPEGEPKLLDFGIARLLDAEDGAFEITAPDHRRLTLAYASPEQVRGEPVTTATDIYSLGALLYELLTGESPRQFSRARPSSTELARVVANRIRVAPVSSREMPKRAAICAATSITLSFARWPASPRAATPARPPWPTISTVTSGRTVRARPDTFTYRAGKFIRRNKVAVTAGALLAITLLAGLNYYSDRGASRATPLRRRSSPNEFIPFRD